MKVEFWGVRGAIPAPGLPFMRYGGNTVCVSVEFENGAVFVLDAGTGVIDLGNRLMAGAFGRGEGRAVLLLTHAHWDHIQGFPFFKPCFVSGNQITIYGSSGSSSMMGRILEGQMNPHFNPVQSLRNLGATIRIQDVQEGRTVMLDGVAVTARSVPHGHLSSLAFRLEHGGSSLVYVPDAGYAGGQPSADVLELYAGAGCLIHDATYTPEDRLQRERRGYSSFDIAARVAARCGVSQLALIHYDQDYTDEQVDQMVERCRETLDGQPGGREVELVAAREGLSIEL